MHITLNHNLLPNFNFFSLTRVWMIIGSKLNCFDKDVKVQSQFSNFLIISPLFAGTCMYLVHSIDLCVAVKS